MRFKKLFLMLLILYLVLNCSAAGHAEEIEEAGEAEGGILDIPKDILKKTLELPVKLAEGVFGFELDPLVITPFRTEEHGFNISKNVSVITKKEIESSSASDLPDLLSEEIGIVVSPLLTNPKAALVDIRGFGEASPSNVLVLIDGRRTNQIDLSGTDWAQIDLNTIERIEVVRGASTVLYGDNATGGVINIITKRGTSEKPTVRIGGQMGSFAHQKEFGTLEGYHDVLDYFFSYSHRDENGYRDNNDFKTNDWFGRIVFHPVTGFEFSTSVGFHKDEYGAPGALYQSDLGNRSRRGTRFPNDRARVEDTFISGVPKLTLTFPDNTLTASVHNTYRRRESDALNISSATWHSRTTHEIDSGDIRPKFELESILFDGQVNNNLVLGNDFFIAMDESLSGNILAARNTTQVTKRTTALYAYDNIVVADRFLCNTGYRYEWVDYRFEQKGQATANDRQNINEWAYEIGGGYKYNPRSQVYITHSRSFRFPNTDEYYSPINMFWGVQYGGLNRNIEQQVGHNLEVGVKDNTIKWLVVNADVYWIKTKREIYYDINDPAFIGNTNYSPRTKRFGFDIEAKANLLDGRFVPYINYTRQRARFHGGKYDNNDFPMVPINKLTAGITAIPLENVTWNMAFNYVGSKFRINDPSNDVQKLNSYFTVDTKLSYKWKNLTVYGSVKNLLNREYWVYGSTNAAVSAITYYPAPGTTFEAGGIVEF